MHKTSIYGFDFENRLITHTTSAGNAYDYKYDGLGNRLRKHMGTAVTRYIYDTSGPLSRLMATSGDQNFASTFWIYGLGLIKDGDGRYMLEDASGNVRFATTSSGGKSASNSYDPFGNNISTSGLFSEFQYNTQQLDTESNMYFLRARYYDPETGRFISRDPVKGPLTLPQTQNPYSYAINNPINFSDPSGEQAVLTWFEQNLPTFTRWGQNAVQACQKLFNSPVVQKAGTTVYQEAPNSPPYVGITNDLTRRAGEHAVTKGIQIEPLIENLSRSDARAVEQALIEKRGLDNILNKINSISSNNPVYPEAVKRGQSILEDLGL